MQEKGNAQADALCPFYRADDSRRKIIVCEGPWKKSTLRIFFRIRSAFEKQLRGFCCAGFAQCPVHGMIIKEKYSDGREEE